MGLQGIALLLLISTLSATATNITSENRQDQIGKALNVFNVVKFPNDACTSTSSNYNGTCYTATECKTLGGTASGTCASSFGVCCVFSLACGQMSSQNNTYIEQATYTLGTDADPCTYKICPSGTVSKLKLEFTSLILTAPAGDAKYDAVTAASPFYTGHCIEDSLNIASPGHASPPEICGVNTGQHMFIPMDTCVTININIGTSAGTRSWQILAIQYEAGNLMAPEGNCLQYHTASSGTFASFAWDFATYGEAQAATTTGIAPYTQFHLANQHYNVCFRREQGKTAICYTPKILGSAINAGATAQPTSAAASFGLGGSSSNNAAAIGATQQTDGVLMVVDGTSAAIAADTTGVSACQGYTVFAKIAGDGDGRTTGDYLEIPQAFSHTSGAALPTGVSTSLITRVCGNVFSAAATVIAVGAAISTDNPGTVCSRTTPFRVGVHMDSMEAMGEGTATEMVANYAAKFDNYFDVANAPNGWNKNEGHGYSGFYLEYFQTA